MAELKKIHITEIATLYAVQDKPDAYYYDAKEADRKMLELELALWNARAERASLEEFCTDPWFAQKWFKCEEKCRKKAAELRKKLEEMKNGD